MGASRIHRAFLLVMLVALLWQSYLIGTHVHPATGLPSVSSAIGTGTPQLAARDRQVPGRSDTCPICQELAQAGHYLPPAPVLVEAPARSVPPSVAAAPLSLPLQQQRSHGWQSRAPPTFSRT